MIVSYFIPELGSAAHTYFDLARAFVKKDHEVDVITSYPREFNLDKADISKEFPLQETIDGVNIHRCKHYAKRDNIVMRGVEHFLLSRHYFRKYKKVNKNFDMSLIYIPPLPLYYFSRKIKRYDGTPSVLNFQDFHPQELTDVEVMKNRFMIKIMQRIERKSYKYADFITVLSYGGIEYVVKRGGNPKKIKHIYNGVHLEDFKKIKKDFKKKEGIENKFLISYAGILSPFQGVDNILDVAKKLIGDKNLVFYIVGDGMIKNQLEKRIRDEKISNTKLLPLQSRDEYLNIINSSDLSFISLDSRMKAPCLPGKLLNLMGVKQPIIAIVPTNSEAAFLVKKAECGFVVRPGDVDQLSKRIIELKKNPELRNKLANKGNLFLKENMDLDKIVLIYEQIFNSLSN